MKGWSSELIYLLLFGAVMLINYFLQRIRKDQPEETPPARKPPQNLNDFAWGRQPHAPPDVPDEFIPAAIPPAIVHRAVHPTTEELPPEAGVTRARPAAPVAASRYSRQALLGSKRRLQDAVVVATILGPCRALDPYDPGR